MTTLYGIKNCDSVKKARQWLDNEGIPYHFHDFKTDGLTKELLSEFINKSALSVLINKRSTTFRQLSDEIKSNLTDTIAIQQILTQPTLLKRPILAHNQTITVGFKAPDYQHLLSRTHQAN